MLKGMVCVWYVYGMYMVCVWYVYGISLPEATLKRCKKSCQAFLSLESDTIVTSKG